MSGRSKKKKGQATGQKRKRNEKDKALKLSKKEVGERYRALPDAMRAKFTEDEHVELLGLDPEGNWEQQMARANFDTVFTVLREQVKLEKNLIQKANAIYDHLHPEAPPASAPRDVRSQLPRPLPTTPTRESGDKRKTSGNPSTCRLSRALEKRLVVAGKDPLEQLEKHFVDLLALRGDDLDKCFVPCLATSGIAGSGKTELLLHLCETWDTFSTLAGDSRNRAQSHLQHLNGMLPSGSPILTHLVVLFATYNQRSPTMFSETLDTSQTIESRLLHRFAVNYYGDGTLATGYTTHDFLAAIRQTVDPSNPKGVGVLLCVDELMKMKDGLHKPLLDHIAAVQQEELFNGFATVSLVTSLSLWPVAAHWVSSTQRKMAAIDLPMLPVDEVKEVVSNRFKSSENSEVWEQFVSASLDSTGGHPRQLREAFFHLKDVKQDDMTRWSEMRVNIEFESACHMWTEVFAKQIATRKPVRKLAHVLSKDTTPLYALTISSGFVMAEPVSTVSHLYSSFELDFTAIPQFFLACPLPVGPQVSPLPFEPKWVSALHQALWTLPDESACKTWEQGMVAAMALTAKAHLDNNGKAPTLQELLPEAHFSDDTLKNWRVDVSIRRKFKGAATSAEMWPRDENEDEDDASVFHRYARNRSQRAVEGSVELLTPEGKRALGWLQNKLYANTSPSKAMEWIVSVAEFHKEEFSFAAKHCLILFCTGDAKKCFEKVQLNNSDAPMPIPVVFVGSNGCDELLAPFGASVLRKKFESRNRDQ